MAALRRSRSRTAGPTAVPRPSTPRTRDNQNSAAVSARAPRREGSRPTTREAERSPGPGSRIALRNWRISTRLVSLLALPVVAATTLGALRINQSMDDIQQLDNMKLLTDMTKQATELAAALQKERDQSVSPLAHGAKPTDITVKGVRDATDVAKQQFIEGTQEIDTASANGQLTGVRDSLVAIAGELNKLSTIRNGAYSDAKNSQTVDGYHRLITQLINLSQDMAEATSNPEMISRTRALSAFSSAKEYASVQRAVIAAALPAGNTTFGQLSENDRLYANSAQDSEASERTSFASIYGTGAEDLTKPIDQGNPTIQAADAYSNRVLGSTGGLNTQDKRSYKDWVDDDTAKIEQMSKIELTLLNQMEQKARELKNASQQEAIISGALILLVLGVSLVGAFVVARSMIRSLRLLPGHRDQGRPGPSARAGQAALRVRPAGRRHLRRVRRCALPGRDRPGGRGLRRRAPRGRPTGRRAGPPARQRQRDVHQPLAPLPGPHPASALAHLRAGVPRGRPGPAVLPLQARPPRDPHAP